MSVTINVIKNGRPVRENIFGGRSISLVLDYLNDNNINYTIRDIKDTLEQSKENNETLIYIDDTNVLGIENSANFVTEYSLNYDEELYNDLLQLLQA